jgi:aspartate/methionine/tyrosine aminotransferase
VSAVKRTTLQRSDLVPMLRELARASGFSPIDASIGSPVDPPPRFVPGLLASSDAERGYPRSDGDLALRLALADWYRRRFGVVLGPSEVAASIGSKELLCLLPTLLARMRPGRDVVVVPEICFTPYLTGAELAGLEVFPAPLAGDGGPQLETVPDAVAQRVLMAFVNSPSNPTGRIYDLAPRAAWAREHGVVLVSDECYSEYGWTTRPHSVLELGRDLVLSVVSLSKRSNLAGLRIGAYAGDPELVDELVRARRSLGLIPAGPSQAAAAGALADEAHVATQRQRYQERLALLAVLMAKLSGREVAVPEGGLYLWVEAPEALGRDGDSFARRLATELGLVVAPGSGFGDRTHVRVAATVTTREVAELEERLA